MKKQKLIIDDLFNDRHLFYKYIWSQKLLTVEVVLRQNLHFNSIKLSPD